MTRRGRDRGEDAVAAILFGDAAIMDLLRALRATDRRLHLGAGLIRSTIWDRLHRRPAAASGGDADVVYFDPARASPRHDADIDARLRRLRPSIPWETTNQARMRDPNEGLRDDWSLAHAVAGWPETCTAIAVRLRDDDRLEFVAPWGVDDLLDLIVRPTPAFETRLDVIAARVRVKAWRARWPKLTFRPACLASPEPADAPPTR